MEPGNGAHTMFQGIRQEHSLDHRKNPNTTIEIAGEDIVCYGGLQPSSSQTWKQWAETYLESAGVAHQIKWKGRLTYFKYQQWLAHSWCHVYLTRSYVCSWSLLDALASGTPIVASNNKPVLEYCQLTPGVELVNNDDITEIAQKVNQTIKTRHLTNRRDLQDARQDQLLPLDLKQSLRAWELVTGLNLNTSD